MNTDKMIKQITEVVNSMDHPIMIVLSDGEIAADIYNESFANMPPEIQDSVAVAMIKRVVDGLE